MKPAIRRVLLPSLRVRHLALAVLLPFAASAFTAHYHVFDRAPYALSILAVAVVASIAGIGPSLLAAAVAVACRFVFSPLADRPLQFTRLEVIRTVVILSVAMVISLMTRSRRRAVYQVELAHAELQERTDALIQSLHSSKCATWTMDVSTNAGPIWYLGSYQIFGRPFVENAGIQGFLSLLHPEDSLRIGTLMRQLQQTEAPILWEFRAAWPSGEIHWFEMRATRVPRTASLWRGLTVDITDRKQAEFALLRSEKLAAMGRLASTVAHEINNPLEAVTNLLFLAQADPTLSPNTQAYLATADRELARLGEITRLTLGFVRTTSARGTIEIAPIADEVLSIFRHRLESKGAQIERNFQPGIEVEIAPHELRQILTNLISNAADAMNGTQSRIAVLIHQSPADTVQVVVEDNGSGIDPAALPRVFEPFFTTKHDIGTGIGLWVTRELVESNGGKITAESGTLPNGVRTRFTVDFPTATV